MEQNLNDKPLSNMQIARYIESLRKEMNFDDEVYGLVKSDLEDGLTQEQTEKYLDKNFNIGQMRVLSEGLHKGIPEELFNILHNNKLSGNQMKVSLEFYEKGVPVETIQEAVARGEKPVVMRRLYEEVLAQLSKAAEQYTQDSEYVKELIAQMEMVVEKINYQEERYDALNKKLSDVEVLKEDKEVTERLVKENEDKDGIISHQQDELNKAKSTAKNIVDETKAKGRAALYRVTEFVGIKKRLLNVRTAVKDMIVSTDRDIARIALLAKGLREAGQIVNNAFHTFADKPEVDYSQKEQKHPFTKAVLAPMKAVKKLLVSMELHLDASIDKLDNLAMNVQFDKEKRMEQTKDKEQKAPDTEREIIYSPMVAEPQEYKYNADAFAARKTSEAKQETAGKELPKVREDKAR